MRKGIFCKRTLLMLFALMFFCVFFLSSVGCATVSTEKEITVFSWEDYMDVGGTDDETGEIEKGLIEIFEEQSGIKVNYRTFATCEAMYTELKKDPSACDLICPSEYMILKMKEEDLIREFEMPENYVEYGSEYIKNVFESLGLSQKNSNKTYAVGYMWGTMGLIYNEDKFDASDFDSWYNMLTDERFVGTMTIKDSIRDSYILALALVYKTELDQLNASYSDKNSQEYKTKLTDIFNRTDQQSVDKVEEVLTELKPRLHSFEVDGGKMDLITGKLDINFAWSGDAVCAMYEAEDEELVELGYVVPNEGSNVWFDGFVMTKDADVESSTQFLDYLCSPENAVRNMNYVGYTSCIAGDEVFNDYVMENFYEEDGEEEIDLAYFFDPEGVSGNEYKVKVSNPNGFLFAQYANQETISRCAVMNNFSDEELERINDMWINVKLITLPTYFIILICVAVVLIIVGIVAFKYRDKLLKKLPKFERKNKNRENYKVVKVEKR